MTASNGETLSVFEVVGKQLWSLHACSIACFQNCGGSLLSAMMARIGRSTRPQNRSAFAFELLTYGTENDRFVAISSQNASNDLEVNSPPLSQCHSCTDPPGSHRECIR